MYQTLNYEVRDQAAVITLNRPEMLNPLDLPSGLEFASALERANRDDGVRAVILTGAGKAFSAGGNVRAMAEELEKRPEGLGLWFAELVPLLNRQVLLIRQSPKPYLAAVNGVAAGGGLGWVLACDLILACPEARFDPGYIRIALSPDGGNTFFLPRILGPHKAAELMFLGRPLSAQEALSWGLVNRIVPREDLLAEALQLAGELAAKGALALAQTKALINSAWEVSLAEQLDQERRRLQECSDKPDFRAAIKAFFEKRKAK